MPSTGGMIIPYPDIKQLEFARPWDRGANCFFEESEKYIKGIQSRLPANFCEPKITPGSMRGTTFRTYSGKASFGQISIVQQDCRNKPMFYPRVVVSLDSREHALKGISDLILKCLPEFAPSQPKRRTDLKKLIESIQRASYPVLYSGYFDELDLEL